MVTDETIKQAAKRADKAVKGAIDKYRNGLVTDEDDITGILVGRLDAELDGKIGGLTWSSSVVRHKKGSAAEESRIGADMVIHVALTSEALVYSKGVLMS